MTAMIVLDTFLSGWTLAHKAGTTRGALAFRYLAFNDYSAYSDEESAWTRLGHHSVQRRHHVFVRSSYVNFVTTKKYSL